MSDVLRARELCDRFIREMADNREGKDDAGIAREILKDLRRYGHLTPEIETRLSRWCHTGRLFKRGMPLAQEISVALYDRVIARQD